MTTSMQAAVWQGPDAITVEQIPVPEVPVGWALVEVEYTGICGTDLSILHGTHPARAGRDRAGARDRGRGRRRPDLSP